MAGWHSEASSGKSVDEHRDATSPHLRTGVLYKRMVIKGRVQLKLLGVAPKLRNGRSCV